MSNLTWEDLFIPNETITASPQAWIVSAALHGYIEELINAGVNQTKLSEPFYSVWQWLTQYASDYGSFPSIERTKEKYPDVYVPKFDERPIQDVLDVFYDDLQQRLVRAAVIEVGKKLESNDPNFLAEWNEWVGRIADSQSQVNIVSWRETVDDRFSEYADTIAKKEMGEEPGTGILTGIRYVDEVTHGLLPTDYVLIVGRFDSGKTTLMADTMRAAAKTGNKALVISPEHGVKAMMRKIDCLHLVADPVDIRRGTLGREFIKKLQQAKEDIKRIAGDIMVVSGAGFTVEGVGALVAQVRPNILYIDGATHLVPFNSNQPDWLKVGEVSRRLKHMAVAHNIPVVSVVQEGRHTGKGGKDTIARSDMIGRDADLILHIEAVDDETLRLSMAKYRETIDRGLPVFLRKGKHGLSFIETDDPTTVAFGSGVDWDF